MRYAARIGLCCFFARNSSLEVADERANSVSSELRFIICSQRDHFVQLS